MKKYMTKKYIAPIALLIVIIIIFSSTACSTHEEQPVIKKPVTYDEAKIRLCKINCSRKCENEGNKNEI